MGHRNKGPSLISGLVWGGMIGAAIGLMMAPRAGDETRRVLRERSIEVRERARETALEARQRAAELQQRGRERFDMNRERIARTAAAVRQSAQVAWAEASMGIPPLSGPGSREFLRGVGSPTEHTDVSTTDTGTNTPSTGRRASRPGGPA
jgi:gas vesicle protein